MNNFDYDQIFGTARKFAEKYSKEIIVQDDAHESAFIGDTEYPCIPLKFYAKGSTALYKKLLASGCCTKMEGSEKNGKRIRRVLLWLEPDGVSVHELK